MQDKYKEKCKRSNIQLKETGGITTLLADVKNTTGVETEDKTVKVEILDKQGNVITRLLGPIDSIPAGGTVKLNVAVTADVANAYDFRISEQKILKDRGQKKR